MAWIAVTQLAGANKTPVQNVINTETVSRIIDHGTECTIVFADGHDIDVSDPFTELTQCLLRAAR